jgi:hypothetical protein
MFFIADNDQTRFAARENVFIVRALNEAGEKHHHRKLRPFYKVMPKLQRLG